DVLPAPDDQLLDPAADGEVARVIAPGQVAGPEPAVVHRLLRRLRAVVVADHDIRTADPDLALLSGGSVEPRGRAADAEADARHRQAARAVDAAAARRAHGDRAARLRAAVGLDQPYP